MKSNLVVGGYMKEKKFFTDQRLANIFRWWTVSAVYFFIAWGTGLGSQSTIIDLVFFLSVAIAIFDMLIVNPVIGHMFKTRSKLILIGEPLWYRVRYRLIYIFKTMLIVILVAIIYNIINITAISLMELPSDMVVLPGEPILFGIFYMIFYDLLDKLVASVKRKIDELEE